MPNIIKWGVIPGQPRHWYEDTAIVCRVCDSKFLLDTADLTDGAWWEEKGEDWHTVEGPCPVCGEQLRVDVRKLLENGFRALSKTDSERDPSYEGDPLAYVDDSDY